MHAQIPLYVGKSDLDLRSDLGRRHPIGFEHLPLLILGGPRRAEPQGACD